MNAGKGMILSHMLDILALHISFGLTYLFVDRFGLLGASLYWKFLLMLSFNIVVCNIIAIVMIKLFTPKEEVY